MPKTASFTTITPLPAGITRKSVRDMYHDHLAMIDLNPLVVERFCCRPPSYAPTDEYYATWYTIRDKVSYLPGGLAQGSVSYHASFQDLPDGLQTHVYAPLGLDIRGKWTIGGSLPGEPKQRSEKGISTPRHGLYIREDVTMTCSSLLIGFVKRTFKDSHASLVEKLFERAHTLEANFANERLQALRNVDPGDRMAVGDIFIAPPPDYSQPVLADPPHPTRSHPLPPPLHRFATSPAQLLPTQTSHNRSQSDPVASPGLSQASTLTDEYDRALALLNNAEKLTSLTFAPAKSAVSASAPQSSELFLPATTYDGSLSQNEHRPLSLYPGGHRYKTSEPVIPLQPRTPGHQRKESNVSPIPPRISYTLHERPISFTFSFPESAFDTKSVSATSSNSSNILDDIDDAIDQVFMYSLPTHTSTKNAPSTSVDILPATRYEPKLFLPSTTYDPRHERKDSVAPSQVEKEDEGPPVPLKDEKYRRKM